MIRDPRAVLNSWLTWDEAWTERPLETILRDWRRSVYELERWASHASVLSARYEDLAGDPEGALRRVLTFLNLDYPEDILDRAGSGRLDGRYDAHGQIGTGSIDRWREELVTEHVTRIEAEVCAEMLRLGYVPSSPLTLRQRLRSEARRYRLKARLAAGRLRRRLQRSLADRRSPSLATQWER